MCIRDSTEAEFEGNYCAEYGFKVQTPQHTYMLRCNPNYGDYNFYLYAYVSRLDVYKRQVQGLPGAVFEITALEDVYTLDGTLRYSAGEVVDTITTGEDGTAQIQPLYLGKFQVKEIQFPHGMVDTGENVTNAVSYTHLDVYKRQAIKAAEISAAGKSIYAYDKGSKVAQAYADVSKEVLADGEKQRAKLQSSLSR